MAQQAAGLLPRGRPGKNVALRPHVNEANCISLLLGYYAAGEVQYAAEEATAFFDLPSVSFEHPYSSGQMLAALVSASRWRPNVIFGHLRIELTTVDSQRVAKVSVRQDETGDGRSHRDIEHCFGEIHPDVWEISAANTLSIPARIIKQFAELLGPPLEVNETAFWQAIDPNRNLAIDASPVG